MGREDVLIADVGLHKLWIGRMFPAHEPGTVLIANGLAGMGFALPSAIAAKLVHPRRNVVAVSGDGGFLMNVQELETAVRLRTAFVNVVWENRQYGSIVWKQDKKFGRHFGTDFANPDFVKLAEAFGMPAWRAASVDDFRVAPRPRADDRGRAVADRAADRLLRRRRRSPRRSARRPSPPDDGADAPRAARGAGAATALLLVGCGGSESEAPPPMRKGISLSATSTATTTRSACGPTCSAAPIPRRSSRCGDLAELQPPRRTR